MYDLCRRLSHQQSNVVFFLIVANPGLLIVDHIHFQYNGLLLGNLPAICLLLSLLALEHCACSSGIERFQPQSRYQSKEWEKTSNELQCSGWELHAAQSCKWKHQFRCAGMLIWSMGFIIEGRDLTAGILFAALVNMKHLFASLGPIYFVYLLRHYCR